MMRPYRIGPEQSASLVRTSNDCCQPDGATDRSKMGNLGP